MHERAPEATAAVRLSPRERRVLELLSHGLTQAIVADEMGIRPTTVSTCMHTVRLKLRAKNEAHAVANAILLRLIR